MIHYDPRSIVRVRATGIDNMGDVSDPHGGAPRFGLRENAGKVPWVLLFVRGIFSLGTGSATLTMKIDHPDESQHFDFKEREWLTVGTGGTRNIQMIILPEELALFTYQWNSELVFEWANPNAGTMRWAIEVGMARAA